MSNHSEESRFTRREFLATASAAMIAAHHAPFAQAPADSFEFLKPKFFGSKEKLVVIHLRGGNDGFNTLVPYTSRDYYESRPNIALRGNEIIKINEKYAINSALSEIADLFKSGMVASFPSVGRQDGFPMSHERAAQAWADNLETPVKVIDDFDTHADQKAQHFEALKRFSLFVNGLRPQLDESLVFVFSEFGRAWEENDSLGTNHANNALCFAIGKRVSGGIYGAIANNEKFIDHSKLCAAVIA